MLFLGTEKYPREGEYTEFIAQNGGVVLIRVNFREKWSRSHSIKYKKFFKLSTRSIYSSIQNDCIFDGWFLPRLSAVTASLCIPQAAPTHSQSRNTLVTLLTWLQIIWNLRWIDLHTSSRPHSLRRRPSRGRFVWWIQKMCRGVRCVCGVGVHGIENPIATKYYIPLLYRMTRCGHHGCLATSYVRHTRCSSSNVAVYRHCYTTRTQTGWMFGAIFCNSMRHTTPRKTCGQGPSKFTDTDTTDHFVFLCIHTLDGTCRRVCVVGRESLDELKEMVTEKFSGASFCAVSPTGFIHLFIRHRS